MDYIFILLALFFSTRVHFLLDNMTHTALIPRYKIPMIVFIIALALYYGIKLYRLNDKKGKILTIFAMTLMSIGIVIPYKEGVTLLTSAHTFAMSSSSFIIIVIVARMIYQLSFIDINQAIIERNYLIFVIGVLSAIFYFTGNICSLFEFTGLVSFILFLKYHTKNLKSYDLRFVF